MAVVDVHTHFVPHGWPDLGDGMPRLRIESERDATIMLGTVEFRRITAHCWDASQRLADMDADGVDVQVLSPTPVFFSYDGPPDKAGRIARVFNDFALEVCAPAGARLV